MGNSFEPIDLLRGGQCHLPESVSKCPECGSKLCIFNDEWNSKTGWPTQSGFSLHCIAEEEELDKWEDDENDERSIFAVGHKYWQSDWQPVRDVVWKWIQHVADEQPATWKGQS